MLTILAIAIMAGRDTMQATEYLSDIPERLVHVEQAWGLLGYDVSAHEATQTPLPLQIGSKHYKKGLGSHAAGKIVVDLDGRYTFFDAEVGVAKQDSTEGAVIFRVLVDGKKRFDSGVMRQTDPAKSVHVDVAGAQELTLVADPGSEGIICDAAEWAEARLTVSANPKPSRRVPFDVAPFAQVTTWDPARMDGVRAGRIEEFHAEDVFLDRPAVGLSSGGYPLPANGCIGLLWLEPRRPDALILDLKPGSAVPETAKAQVHAWVGIFPFQGSWKALVGSFKTEGKRITFDIDRKTNPDFARGFRKVRWVFPRGAGRRVFIEKLGATISTRMKSVTLALEAEPQIKGQAIVSGFSCDLDASPCEWDMSHVKRITVRYPVGMGSDEGPAQSALRLSLPHGGFTVRIADILAGRGTYLRDAGIYAARASIRGGLAAYKKSIAAKTTILERVRSMPDQTFARAMKRTYRAVHFGSPTLLSVGPDNWKWLVEPDGQTAWEPAPEVADRQMGWERRRCSVDIAFNGSPLHPTATPKLPKAVKRWMPLVALEGGAPGESCRYTAYAAPSGGRRGVLVGRIDLDTASAAKLELTFQRDRNVRAAAELVVRDKRALVMDGDRLMAVVDLGGLDGLAVSTKDGVIQVAGWGKGSVLFAVPGWEAAPTDLDLQTIDEGKLRDAFVSYWNAAASEGMQIQIPDPLLSDIIESSQVRCMVDARNQDDGARIAPWIAEIHYGPLESEANTIIRGMGLMGHKDFAEKSLDYFINLYNPAGFLTTGYTLVGTGWHLWTLGEGFGLYRDAEWMKGHAEDVARVCRWVIGERRKTMKLDPLGRKPPQYGLFTPGVIADWNAYHYYFYSNGTYCAGLEAAGRALKAVGYKDADAFIEQALAYRKDILTAYRRTQALTPAVPLQDGTWVPGQPSQIDCPGPLGEYFPGEDASRAWAYDVEIGAHQLMQQGVIPANGKDSYQISDYLEDELFFHDGWGDYPASESKRDWFDLGGFSRVQPYYLRLAEVYAMRDDVKPFIRAYFNMIASLIDPSNLTIWEHFDHMGAPDKTHETGVFLQQTRFMLVDERGDELWLAPMVTNNWLKDGMVVSVAHAPTRFGEAGYRIESHVKQGFIEATIDAPSRSRPSAVVIRLRHPQDLRMKSVTVNGKPWKDFDPKKEVVRIPAPHGRLVVRVSF